MCGRAGERADDAGGPVAPLNSDRVRRTVRPRQPVDEVALAQRGALERLDDAVHQLGLVLAALQRGGAQERVRVAREAVCEAEVVRAPALVVLRPDARAELRIERPRRPQPADRGSCDVVLVEQSRGDERAARAVKQFVPRIVDARRCSGAEARDVSRCEGDAYLAVGVAGPVAWAGSPVDLAAERAQRVDVARDAGVHAFFKRRPGRDRLVDDVRDRVPRKTLVPRTSAKGLVLLGVVDHTVASRRAPRPSGASVSSSNTKKSRPMTCTATLYTGTAPIAPENVPACACPCSTRSGGCFWIGPSSLFDPRYVQIDSGSPASVLIVGE